MHFKKARLGTRVSDSSGLIVTSYIMHVHSKNGQLSLYNYDQRDFHAFKADTRLVMTLKLPNQDDNISKVLLTTFS